MELMGMAASPRPSHGERCRRGRRVNAAARDVVHTPQRPPERGAGIELASVRWVVDAQERSGAAQRRHRPSVRAIETSRREPDESDASGAGRDENGNSMGGSDYQRDGPGLSPGAGTGGSSAAFPLNKKKTEKRTKMPMEFVIFLGNETK